MRFAKAPGDRGTEVHVELQYDPPAGSAGAAIAKLFGEEPGQQVRDDLRRFKQVMETGEVVRSDGSLEGAGQGAARSSAPAQAAEQSWRCGHEGDLLDGQEAASKCATSPTRRS